MWGYNGLGGLGDGSFTSRTAPVQSVAASSWQDVSANAYSTVAIRSDRTLWSWGYNNHGQLGDLGEQLHRDLPLDRIAGEVTVGIEMQRFHGRSLS